MNTYEILFLFDPTFGTAWDKVEAEINRLMQRAGAEVILTKRLEERRLAFEIQGRKRGLYAITYFKVDGGKITSLERDARLSESILRVLVLRADGLSMEKMNAATLGGMFHDSRPGRDGDRSHGPRTSRGRDDEGSLVGAADLGEDLDI